jgi:hypothetical protein
MTSIYRDHQFKYYNKIDYLCNECNNNYNFDEQCCNLCANIVCLNDNCCTTFPHYNNTTFIICRGCYNHYDQNLKEYNEDKILKYKGPIPEEGKRKLILLKKKIEQKKQQILITKE